MVLEKGSLYNRGNISKFLSSESISKKNVSILAGVIEALLYFLTMKKLDDCNRT